MLPIRFISKMIYCADEADTDAQLVLALIPSSTNSTAFLATLFAYWLLDSLNSRL